MNIVLKVKLRYIEAILESDVCLQLNPNGMVYDYVARNPV